VEGTGRLGGSACSLLQGVRWLVSDLALPLESAIFMAAAAPARILGVPKGRLCPGADADLLLLDRELEVRKAMVEGEWRLER